VILNNREHTFGGHLVEDALHGSQEQWELPTGTPSTKTKEIADILKSILQE
jgi:hypothetical protein